MIDFLSGFFSFGVIRAKSRKSAHVQSAKDIPPLFAVLLVKHHVRGSAYTYSRCRRAVDFLVTRDERRSKRSVGKYEQILLLLLQLFTDNDEN